MDPLAEQIQAENSEGSPAYQRWIYQQQQVERSCATTSKQTERGEEEKKAAEEFQLTCRKCRRPLATSSYLLPHPSTNPSPSPKQSPCAHHFLHPLSWMRPELEQGKLDGRLECPKCRTNVGKYAWQGMRCNCGEWVVPAVSLARGRVDVGRMAGRSAAGIRMPVVAVEGVGLEGYK